MEEKYKYTKITNIMHLYFSLTPERKHQLEKMCKKGVVNRA